MYKKISLSALVFGALLAVNGCGGGGTTGSTPVSSQAISGVAVDDLILDGVINAKDPNGVVLSTGRTSDSDGTYTINVNYTGVVLVNVTCDENSTMVNPNTQVETACGTDVSLNSLGTVEAGTDLTVNISPLTEIVYQRAEALAGGDISNIDSTDVEDARTEIGLMFSVDPLVDDPTADTYADIIGTIHTLADADPDTSVIDITNLLAEELADGEADGTADATLSTLVQIMADENLTNNLVDTNGTYIPPEEPASLSDIDEAKALFTKLRTQAMSLTDYANSGTPGFLDTEALDMEQALNGVVLNIGFMEMALNYQLDIESFMRYNNLTVHTEPIGPTRTLTLTITGSSSYDYVIAEGATTWSGTVSYPDMNVIDINSFTTLSAQVDGKFPLSYEGDIVADGVENSQSFNGLITVNKTANGASIEIGGTVASNGTSFNLSDATAELTYDVNTTTGEPILNYFKLNGLTLQGIVSGYTIDGSIQVNSYVQNTSLASKGGIEEIFTTDLSGRVTCSDGSGTPYFYAPIQVTFDSQTYDIYTDANGYFYTQVPGTYTFNDLESILMNNVSFDDTVCPVGSTPSASVYHSYIWSETNIANSGWVPNNITFTGKVSRTGASIEGTLNAIWKNAETLNFEYVDVIPMEDVALVDITLNGKLQMPGSPEILLALSYENNATHNMLGASYTYDTTVINMSATFDKWYDNGDVVITTHTGLRADINKTYNYEVNPERIYSGEITKDGALLGTLEERLDVPVIKYIDGSFESLP